MRDRNHRRYLHRAAHLLPILVLVLAACTTEPGPPPAGPSADAFLGAWGKRDAGRMAELLEDSERSWGPVRIRGLLRRTMRQGALGGWSIERAGPTEEPDGASSNRATVPYSITYSSRAMASSATMEGRLVLRFDERLERWGVRWSKKLLWPEEPRAARLRVAYRWPRRAAILDRAGRPLAVGPSAQRRYPQGAVAGNVVGHLAPRGPGGRAASDAGSSASIGADPGGRGEKELGRRPGDLVGASGLEAAYEHRLSGAPRSRVDLVDRDGEVVRVLGRAPGAPARPLRSTLGIGVQRAAQEAFGATVGGAVVLDPRSGDLLAAVTSAPMDPRRLRGATVDPFNRALSGLYPPGSSMKVVTAAAALESEVVTPSTRLSGPREYKGVRNFESGAFGSITFADAVTNSVNTAFAQVAERLGARRLTRYARAFGFGRPPGTRLGAATSSFPSPSDEGDLMWSSIGQAQVVATPLQMATVAATIANGGVRVEPRVTPLEERRTRRVVSASTARTTTVLMASVVAEGTGTRAALPGVTVAGKTGTAEVDVDGERRNHAWFICFAPVNDPRVAVAVVSEYGGIGGEVAAPLAARILARVLPLAP